MHPTKIAWTEENWSPCTGCTKISAGCKNCYMFPIADNLQKRGVSKYANGHVFTIHPELMLDPLHLKKPRMIFTNSMSDLFHPEMPNWFLDCLFRTMKEANWHTFQILTKRPGRMLNYFSEEEREVPPNVWLGVSVEDIMNKPRLDLLRKIPCNLRFVSFGPLLEELGELDLTGISWVIVEGESGKNHRSCKPEWVRSIRDQCVAKAIPFFFKGLGGITQFSGGRTLDGRTWDEYPEQYYKAKAQRQDESRD